MALFADEPGFPLIRCELRDAESNELLFALRDLHINGELSNWADVPMTTGQECSVDRPLTYPPAPNARVERRPAVPWMLAPYSSRVRSNELLDPPLRRKYFHTGKLEPTKSNVGEPATRSDITGLGVSVLAK